VISRAVELADIPAVRALAGCIWRAYYPGIISPEQIEYMLERMYAPEVIREELAAGVIWELLVDGDRPVGFLSCAYEPEGGKLKLSKLYVLPEWHGRGIGQQMLAWVKAKALAFGAKQIYLTVNKRNARAIRAYERAGFRIADAVVSDIGCGFVMDDYVMKFEVPTGPQA
jgi:GNAT superfamily N-acetyltransferase